jgi:hypothetical protein
MQDIAATRNKQDQPDEHEAGLCDCGCGQQTKLAPRNRRDRGWIKGQPLRWRHGHHGRKRVRHVEVPTGFTTPCWLWQLAKDTHGYGVTWADGRMSPAHRVNYEERHGRLPAGVELDHLCRVRACVRPEHLEPVTHAENCRRGARAKLTADEVAAIRESSETQRVIARRYGVTQGHIARIRRGEASR